MADTSPNRNRSYVSSDGKSSTFGRSLVQYIQNRLPYTDTVNSDDQLNPKYKFFNKTGGRRAEALAKTSVSSSNSYNNVAIGEFGKDTTFADVMYASINEDKPGRVRDYRIMAAYSEIADALDEICDETINENDVKGVKESATPFNTFLEAINNKIKFKKLVVKKKDS